MLMPHKGSVHRSLHTCVFGAVVACTLSGCGGGSASKASPGTASLVLPAAQSSTYFSAASDNAGGVIAAGGFSSDGQSVQMQLARFAPETRALDVAFGDGGVVNYLAPGRTHGYVDAVATLDDGRIIACGVWYTPVTGGGPSEEVQATLVAFNSDGSVDSSFGVDGRFDVPAVIGPTTYCLDLAITESAIYFGGANAPFVRFVVPNADAVLPVRDPTPRPAQSSGFVGKLSLSGQPDPGFGVSGIARINSLGVFDVEAPDGDDGVAALGISLNGGMTTTSLHVLTSNGSNNLQFAGGNPVVLQPFRSEADIFGFALTTGPNGEFVAGSRQIYLDESEQFRADATLHVVDQIGSIDTARSGVLRAADAGDVFQVFGLAAGTGGDVTAYVPNLGSFEFFTGRLGLQGTPTLTDTRSWPFFINNVAQTSSGYVVIGHTGVGTAEMPDSAATIAFVDQ